MIFLALFFLQSLPALAAAKQPSPKMSWKLSYTAKLGVSYDETVLPRTGNTHKPEPSIIADGSGGFSSQWQKGRNFFKAGYNLRFKKYNKVWERDSHDHRLELKCRIFPTNRLQLNFSDRFTRLEDTGGEADESISVLSTYNDNYLTSNVTYRLAKKITLKGAFTNQTRDYKERVTHDWFTVGTAYEIGWQPRSNGRWTLQYKFKYLDITGEEQSKSHEVLAGYAVKLPLKLDFDLRVGILNIQEGPSLEPAGEVRISRRWDKAKIAFRWKREATVSSGASRVVRRDFVSILPSYRFNNNTKILGTMTYLLQKSVNDYLTDITTWRFGFRLQQRITKSFSINVNYTYVNQDVRGQNGVPLNGNIVGLGLTASF